MKNFDFTLETYKIFLEKILEKQYIIRTVEDYLINKDKYQKIFIIRKDVDKKPENSLWLAKIEKDLGIISTYYFRIVKKSNNPEIIRKIAAMGHEIGYHYEDLTLAKGNFEEAIKLFAEHLNYFRQFYPVKTICLHGSPLMKWDNKELWNKYDYRDYNIIGEPYFDIDYNDILYLTDTGRRWNGAKVSVRDKVEQIRNPNYESTFDIMNALDENSLPDKVVITIHPQRWDDHLCQWVKEFAMQNSKNAIKYFVVKFKK